MKDGANVSEGIYELLMLAGIETGRPASRLERKRAERTAIRNARRMKERAAASEGAGSLSEADAADMNAAQPTGAEGGQRGPIYLAWKNPTTMTKSAARKATFLVMLDGGLA